jgi:hypothetical protein
MTGRRSWAIGPDTVRNEWRTRWRQTDAETAEPSESLAAGAAAAVATEPPESLAVGAAPVGAELSEALAGGAAAVEVEALVESDPWSEAARSDPPLDDTALPELAAEPASSTLAAGALAATV